MNRFCHSLHQFLYHPLHHPLLLALALLLTTAFFVWLGREQTALLLPLLGAVFALSGHGKTCTAGWRCTPQQSNPDSPSDTPH